MVFKNARGLTDKQLRDELQSDVRQSIEGQTALRNIKARHQSQRIDKLIKLQSREKELQDITSKAKFEAQKKIAIAKQNATTKRQIQNIQSNKKRRSGFFSGLNDFLENTGVAKGIAPTIRRESMPTGNIDVIGGRVPTRRNVIGGRPTARRFDILGLNNSSSETVVQRKPQKRIKRRRK